MYLSLITILLALISVISSSPVEKFHAHINASTLGEGEATTQPSYILPRVNNIRADRFPSDSEIQQSVSAYSMLLNCQLTGTENGSFCGSPLNSLEELLFFGGRIQGVLECRFQPGGKPCATNENVAESMDVLLEYAALISDNSTSAPTSSPLPTSAIEPASTSLSNSARISLPSTPTATSVSTLTSGKTLIALSTATSMSTSTSHKTLITLSTATSLSTSTSLSTVTSRKTWIGLTTATSLSTSTSRKTWISLTTATPLSASTPLSTSTRSVGNMAVKDTMQKRAEPEAEENSTDRQYYPEPFSTFNLPKRTMPANASHPIVTATMPANASHPIVTATMPANASHPVVTAPASASAVSSTPSPSHSSTSEEHRVQDAMAGLVAVVGLALQEPNEAKTTSYTGWGY